MRSIVTLSLILSLPGLSVPLRAQDAAESGFLRAAVAREAVRLSQGPTALPSNPSKAVEQRQNWILRHPVLVSALVGAGIGIAVDTKQYVEDPTGKIPAGGWYTLAFAGAGASAGLAWSAIIGSSLSYSTQNQPDALAVKHIVARLGTGAKVVIEGPNQARISGTILAIGQDDLSVIREGGNATTQLAYGEVLAIRPKPMSAGAKAGIVAAVIGLAAFGLACAAHCGG